MPATAQNSKTSWRPGWVSRSCIVMSLSESDWMSFNSPLDTSDIFSETENVAGYYHKIRQCHSHPSTACASSSVHTQNSAEWLQSSETYAVQQTFLARGKCIGRETASALEMLILSWWCVMLAETFFLYEVARALFTYQCWSLPHGLAQCTTAGVGQV